jgi:Domain of unknown function (DUF5667)
MTSLHPARRSAERFDALVEGNWHDAVDPRTTELLELVGAMRAVPQPAARPEFVTDLRERLMLAAETELTPAARESSDTADAVQKRLTVAPRRTARERRLAVAIGGFAIVGATASMAVASQSALPGDALYPIKRAIENAEAGFHFSDEGKGTTILANASGRLDEIDAMTSEGSGDAADIESTLDTFSDQASEAGDLLLTDYENTGSEASITQLHDFTSTSIDSLSALEEAIPAQARPALLEAVQVLFTIDSAAAQACPSCAGEVLTEIPPQLLAAGAESFGDAGDEVSAQAPPAGSEPKDGQGTKGSDTGTSGLVAPDNPVQIPSGSASTGQNPEASPSTSVSVDVDEGTGGDGKKKDKPVDLEPVQEAVDDVVEDVSEVLGGLGLGG